LFINGPATLYVDSLGFLASSLNAALDLPELVDPAAGPLVVVFVAVVKLLDRGLLFGAGNAQRKSLEAI
jgi:hypothetical protein